MPSTLTQTAGGAGSQPDGANLTGGGNTQLVYDGSAGPSTLTYPAAGGVLAQFVARTSVEYSPDFTNLAGGGATQMVYTGKAGPPARGGPGGRRLCPGGKNLRPLL